MCAIEFAGTEGQGAEGLVIALDVGGTSVKSAAVGPPGHVIETPVTTPIDSNGDRDYILATLALPIQEHVEGIEKEGLLGVAIGFPGPFDYASGICFIAGLAKYHALYGVNVKQALQTRLDLSGRPIIFCNDAEAAIVGEARYGAGRSYRKLIGVTLGTGCGSAFIRDGRPVTSGAGVPPSGWLYPIDFKGRRADDVFSQRGLEARLKTAAAAETNIKKAGEAARQGDPASLSVFQEFGADLGTFLRPFVHIFEAEVVLVMGGISGAFDVFGKALSQLLPVPVLRGEKGAEAALIGAANLLFG